MHPVILEPSFIDQLALVISVFGIKPFYMLVALVIIKVLWGRPGRDLRLLLASMVAFEAGELFCALNFTLSTDMSVLLEFGHHAGMILFGALLPWGIYALVDERILRFSAQDKTCAAARFCKRCWKNDDLACGLQRLMLFAAPALALIALIPVSSEVLVFSARFDVLGSPVDYQLTHTEQWALYRAYPLAASGLMLTTFFLLLRGRRGLGPAQWSFFLGLGLMAFSFLRFTLITSFSAAPWWADTWEEVTELLTVLGLALALWVFRRPFGLVGSARVDPIARS
jgi:hypothetical protein